MPTKMHKVDFKNIAPRNGSQSDAFEEFCCQIARHTPNQPKGTEFIRYRGAGGDGGVECILRLPNGDEWGWQAKFMFNLSKAKAALDESVETAIKLHPNLKHYTICLPFDLTGPTARKKGKSQREYFDGYITQWEKFALSEGVDMKVLLSTPSSLLDDLLAFDPEGGRLRFWFDANVLSDQWFEHHLQEVKASAGVRYTPELRIETPIGEALEALGLTDEWFESLKGRVKEFTDLLKQLNDALSRTSNTTWGDAFPDSIRQDGERSLRLLRHLAAEYSRIAESKDTTVDVPALDAQAREALSLFRELRVTLAADLDARYGAGSAESQGFRQFQAEYQCSFPAANLDTADDVIRFLEGFSKWVASTVAHLLSATELLIVGSAGVGKTHAICDIAERRHKWGLRTIVLFGERFSASVEPWVQIRQQLGFDATLSRHAILDMLDAAGEASGKPLLLCIDGLNETKPRPYWPSHLSPIITQLRPHEWIRLCISCRTTYESQVIPKALPLQTVAHQGFAGFEFDACKEFFAYYGLEPPVAPILQPEFSNPLFLRLICEAMDAAGQTKLPLGWLGINSAINAFIQAKNERYAAEHDSHPSNRYPERALKALVSSYEQEKTSALPWSKAKQVTETVLPVSQPNASLLDWLIREGMLLVDADPDPFSSTPEDYVRIAFERLGDNLLAAKFLDSLDAQSVQKAFEAEDSLAFAVADLDAVGKYNGLLEALSIQLPERLGLELPDVVPRVELTNDLIKLTVEALPWRDPNHLSLRTGQLLRQSLGFRGFAHTAFDVALSISTRPSSVDAFWLNDRLRAKTMPDRDAFWCGYLYQSYEGQGPVEKLIRAAFAVDVTQIPVEVVERWAVVLLWFCAAADRRVRDYATKALVRISEPVPDVWDTLVDRFISVDDDYVVERCLLGAYGALMRARDPKVEAAVAKRIYEEIFKDSSRFQNQLIRDHARSIVELAAADNVLPSGIVKSRYLPPYESEWPLTIPTAEEVEQYRFSNEDMPRLFHSCMDDDFLKYTLGVLDRFTDVIGRVEGARWIFHHVLEMGYTKERFANYDGYIVYQYGGGRGRPTWAERIGKKYQWIALARLIARVSDHVKFKYDKWQPKPLRTPLIYERGRDIDPSLLVRSTLARADESSWWIPESYDFEAVSKMPHEEWVKVHTDLPDTVSMLSERIDRNGTRWIVLQAYPEWTSKTPQMSDSEPYRLVWFHLHSFLIPIAEAEACWRWLKKQNFFGAWMPEGAEFHDAFFGEYPWATTVNLYGDAYHYRDSFDERKPPSEMYPTANLMNVSHEEDAYQDGSINLLVPAKKFFRHLPMKWDGKGGYKEPGGGRPCFLDPSLVEPGPVALLVEAAFLEDFLSQNNLAIFWTVVGEKLRIVADSWPRLVYSRAHILTAKGLRSSKPVISHD